MYPIAEAYIRLACVPTNRLNMPGWLFACLLSLVFGTFSAPAQAEDVSVSYDAANVQANYAAAKARVWGREAVMVVNRDDPRVEALARSVQPADIPAKGTVRSRAPKPAERQIVRFGLDAPQCPGDFGLVSENGMAWLVRALRGRCGVVRRHARRREGDKGLRIRVRSEARRCSRRRKASPSAR